jgi:hypothetical protein
MQAILVECLPCSMTTEEKLAAVAGALLDSGGEDAVMLRAVTSKTETRFSAQSRPPISPQRSKCGNHLPGPDQRPQGFISTAPSNPARYQVLLNDPRFATLQTRSRRFTVILTGSIRSEYQAAGELPDVPQSPKRALLTSLQAWNYNQSCDAARRGRASYLRDS